MPSSSNLPAVATPDNDPVLCDVAFTPPAAVAAVAFPNKLLINPARYAK
jgi:hypothetical protein